MPMVQVGDAQVHYREAGGGNEAVLLLHAFPLHSGMWRDQLAALAPRFRAIAPDYRGLGASRPATDASTMELLAGDVLALLRALGIRRAAVVGLSMGGYLALELVRRAPEVVRGLVLCDTKAPADTVEHRGVREAFAASALEKGLGWVADDMAPKLLRPGSAPAVVERVRALVAAGTPEGVAAAQRGMARRPDSVPTLARIACPTLIVFGDEDAITPFGEALRLQQGIRGARLVRLPAAGHASNLEAPEAFNAALTSFLAALPA